MKSLVTGSSVNDLIERMKAVSGVKTDAALARVLHISGAAISRWRINKNVPIEYCLFIAENHNASLDYIYRGTSHAARNTPNGINIDVLRIVIKYEWPDAASDSVDKAAQSIARTYEYADRLLSSLIESSGLGSEKALLAVDAFLQRDRQASARYRLL